MCKSRAEAFGELAKWVRREVQEQERVRRREDGVGGEYVWGM